MTAPRYLWFAPNAGVWPSYRLEHRLAQELALDGRAVTLVHCRGLFDAFCPVMSAERLHVDSPKAGKERACADCRLNSRLTAQRAAYDTVYLDDVVTADVVRRARAATESLDASNWADFEVDGIPVGRYASYMSMLHHKMPEVTATEQMWREYLADVNDALITLWAMPTLLERVNPTHAVVYNPLYPANRMFAISAQAHGAQLVGVAAGNFIPARYDCVEIHQHIMASQTATDSPVLSASLADPSTPMEVAAIGRHLRELIAGNDPWVYSSAPSRTTPADVRDRLGIRPDSPSVVVLVSSPDETRSSMLVDAEYMRDSDRGYSDIEEFISAMVDAARAVPDIDVVFRLHPRLLPNKREGVASPDLARIAELLADLPDNAVVNDPSQSLSLYDVMGIAQGAVNQSSTAGLEFLTMGLPVVQYDPPRLGAYPRSFSTLVERHDPEGLVAAVRAMVASGWDLEHSRMAFRWWSVTLLRTLLHMEPIGEAGPARAAVPPRHLTDQPATPAAGVALRLARAVLPDSWRERVARRSARRARVAQIEAMTDRGPWASEWLARLDAVTTTDPIWRPLVMRRGSGTVVEETAAVRAQLDDLLSQLDMRDRPGIGALRSALPKGSGEQMV